MDYLLHCACNISSVPPNDLRGKYYFYFHPIFEKIEASFCMSKFKQLAQAWYIPGQNLDR